ncbi:MAG TPA: diaminopimelate decarboxylase [Acidimicrobiales bacterium]|nr:diaminopimelate decarboxylase [Acidimicrobiales bacterium]
MTGPLPRHLLPLTAEIDSAGALHVGGLDLVALAGEVGTPVFVYDEAHLRARCQEARLAWGDGTAYATKAFLCRAMAALAHEEGLCLDVSTGGELHVALAAGVPAERLVLHGNNKSDDELRTALATGVGRIVVDSFDELDRIERLVCAPPRPARAPTVLIRVTPGVEAHTHEFVRTGQDDSKFGFSLAAGLADEAIARARAMESNGVLRLAGVHAHIGSQIFLLGSFAAEVEALGGWFASLALDELCVGGGLGVAYVEGEDAPSITDWAREVKEACRRVGIPASTRLTAEPGRSIVATAGLTLYTIGTIKEVPGVRTYLSVDGGMSDNPRPVLYGSGYEAFLPARAGAARPWVATVAGKHCESGDVLVRDAHLPAGTSVGDILAVPVTGAYGYSMASNYNKVPRPPVVFVAGGRYRVVVRREVYDDLFRLDE